MRKLGTPEECLSFCRQATSPVVLVPTMGALHEGHASLLALGRKLAGATGTLVASIFVNPIQFGPNEDLARYPRTLEEDFALCVQHGVDAVFVPEAETMYAPDQSAFVDELVLSGVLCGASRPGHFRGVCTVVAKLFHLTAANIAVFGEKDWQQLAVIRRMVRDLSFPVEIVGSATVREADGLAMSSRNRYLSKEERAVAPGIYAALVKAREEATGLARSPRQVREKLWERLEKLPGASVDYAEVVDAETLGEPEGFGQRSVRAIVAVRIGVTRLIDNLAIFSRE